MFSLSVCMIIKNEEQTLERCLECAKQFADEIVIIDTGSTDQSKNIAKKFTDKVFDFVWIDDFSKARNFSFSKATCDYQMWLDADDYVSKENIDKINALKFGNNDADVFMCLYATGFDAQNVPYFVYERERIVKRNQRFKWQGFVHEVIVPSGKIVHTDITIEHRKIGYSDPKRNLNLYRSAIARGEVFNAREQYYYARELYYNGYFQNAIKNFKKFLKMPNSYPPDNLGAYLMLSECYEKIDDNKHALSVLFDALKKHSPTPELCCKIAFLFEQHGDIENAIFWLNSAQICKQENGFIRKDYVDLVPYLELCKIYYQKKDYASAKHYHLLAKSIRPTHSSVQYNEQFFKD
ncbi:MAG: glycosyltransferase [Candidatus Caccovivens sp.]